MKNKVTVFTAIISLSLFFSLSTAFAQTSDKLDTFKNCNKYYVENDSSGGYIFASTDDTLYAAYASDNLTVYYAKIDGIIRSVCRNGAYSYALYEKKQNYYIVGLNCKNGKTVTYSFGEIESLYNLSFTFCKGKIYFIFSDSAYRYIKCYDSDGKYLKTYNFSESVKSVFQNDSKVYAVLYNGDIYRIDENAPEYCTSINIEYDFCNAGDGYLYSESGTLFSLSNKNYDYVLNANIKCIYKTDEKMISAKGKTAYYNDETYVNGKDIEALLIADGGVVIIDKDFNCSYIEFSKFTNQAYINYGDIKYFGKNTTYKITEDGYITGVESQTTVTRFKENLTRQVTLYDKEGKEVTSGKIKTGYRAAVLGDIYHISVTGDVTGEGNVKSNDVSALMSHLTGEKTLEGVYLVSADYNMDGKVDNSDLVYIARYAERKN